MPTTRPIALTSANRTRLAGWANGCVNWLPSTRSWSAPGPDRVALGADPQVQAAGWIRVDSTGVERDRCLRGGRHGSGTGAGCAPPGRARAARMVRCADRGSRYPQRLHDPLQRRFAARSPVFGSDGSESLPDPRLIRVVRRRDMHAHSKQLRRARAAFLSDDAPALNACTTAVHSVGSFRLPF